MSLTYQEIHETYSSLKKIAALVETEASGLSRVFREKILVFVGCGSSYAIAKSLALISSMRFRRPALAMAAGDLLLHADRYAPFLEQTVLVAISRSGSTSEILLAVEALAERCCNFELASLCCVEGSPLSKMSKFVLEMPWAFDKSVCQTRCVTSLYFAGVMLIAKALEDTALLEDLKGIVQGGDAFMASIEPVLQEAAVKDWDHAVVLADAEIAGLAEEGALAYKEICQLPSNFYHLLDARHGPMVLFGPNTLVVIALSSGDKQELDMVRDVIKKGACVIVYSDMLMEIEGALNIAFGQKLGHAARGIPFILINQLVSFYKSKSTGADPDAPTGLDPWIKL